MNLRKSPRPFAAFMANGGGGILDRRVKDSKIEERSGDSLLLPYSYSLLLFLIVIPYRYSLLLLLGVFDALWEGEDLAAQEAADWNWDFEVGERGSYSTPLLSAISRFNGFKSPEDRFTSSSSSSSLKEKGGAMRKAKKLRYLPSDAMLFNYFLRADDCAVFGDPNDGTAALVSRPYCYCYYHSSSSLLLLLTRMMMLLLFAH